MNFLMFLQGGYEFAYFFRPQTKFAKVMFSQMFVCPFVCLKGGGGCFCAGGLCAGGLCSGGSLSREISVYGGLCPGDLCPGGLCPWGSLSMGVSVHGVSVGGLCARGSLCKEVSVQGGLCPGGSLSGRPPVRLRAGGTYSTGMHSCTPLFFQVRRMYITVTPSLTPGITRWMGRRGGLETAAATRGARPRSSKTPETHLVPHLNYNHYNSLQLHS